MASRYSPFRLIKDFLTGDMPRKLSQLEQNVKEKFESDNRRSYGPFTLTDIQTASCAAQPWQFVRLNPSAAMRVTLPSPREPDAGWICLKNIRSSTANIEVRPVGGTIDFAATISMTAPLESLFLVPDREANNWCAIRSSADSIGIGLPGEVLTTVAGPALDWAYIVNANIDAAAAIEVSKLAGSSTPGDVLTDVAGVPTWVAPSSGGGSWVTLYEPDLLGHSSFTYGSDTSHVVDGVNIWAKNTAFGTISIGAAANQGIKIVQTGASGAFFNSTPFVYIEFPDMAALAYGDGPFRIQVQYELVAGFTGVQFQNEIGMGIGSEFGIPAAWNMCLVRKGAGAGTTNQDTLGAYNNGGTNLETTTAAVGSNDVATMLFFPTWNGEYAFSQYSGGYNPPTVPQGKLFYWQTGAAGAQGFTMNQNGSTNVNGYQVCLGINTGNGGSTLGTVYFKRLRVQQWVVGY